MLNFCIIVNTMANEMSDVMKKVEIDVSQTASTTAQRRFGLIVIGDEILSGRRNIWLA